jgi:hypothetical protein
MYYGFDFRPTRLVRARENCPGFQFEVADALTTDLFETWRYDAVIATEFLEHVERDLDVLDSIRPGSYFLGTVPNFPFVSHVRHFRSEAEVTERYAGRFFEFRVDTIIANERGKCFFLLEGIRSAATPNRVPGSNKLRKN